MRPDVAWPYLVPLESPLEQDSAWRITYAGDELHGYQVLGTHLQGWDASATFICQRDFTIDVNAVRESCRLPVAKLELLVIASTGRGRLREVLWRGPLPASGLHQASVSLSFGDSTTAGLQARAALSGDLQLETHIVLKESTGPKEPFAAHTAGNRLWSDTQTVNLDGTGPKLSIIQVNFKEAFPLLRADNADHYVSMEHIDSLDSTVLENIVIYVNTLKADFVERLLANDKGAILDLYEALAVQLAVHAFQAFPETGTDLDDCEPGSVGAVLNSIFMLAFPDLTAGAVQTMFQTEPSKFFTRMQGNVRSLAQSWT